MAAACCSALVFKFVDRSLEDKEEAHVIENKRSALTRAQPKLDRPTFSHRFSKQQLFVVGQVFLAKAAPVPPHWVASPCTEEGEAEEESEVWCINADDVWCGLEDCLRGLNLESDLMPSSRQCFDSWLKKQWRQPGNANSGAVLISFEDFLGALVRLMEDNEARLILEEAENVVRVEERGKMSVGMLMKLLGPTFLTNLKDSPDDESVDWRRVVRQRHPFSPPSGA